MKFTLSWLKTHLDTDATLAEITATLTRIGLELENVEDRGAALAPFRIARVIEAVQHPNADRLRVCTVDTGTDTVRVVCGAPNARTGMKGVFAPPGTFIPGTGITLKVGEIRGVRSAGMLLSEREMGLGEDHAGIVDLPEDAPVGVPYAQWAGLDDPVIDVSVTPNRGDCFSVRGIARDLAAGGIGTLKPWHPAKVAPAFRGGPRWQIDWPEACPWILGRTIRNLRNGPSPHWLQDRLTSIGLRPINALVDITNFFTVDLGRPLHVFDVAKLTGDVLTLRPGRGETFRALNGRDYTVTPEDCAIADAAGVQSMAGVIGGEPTGCDATTTSVFIECALFDPIRVALTGRRHQIVSDARQRFERGIDPALMPDAVEAATAMVLELCGGEPGEVTEAGAPPAWQRTATLRFERIAGLGGSDISADEAVASLQRLGFARADPRRDARHRRGAVLAQRRRGEDRAGTVRNARCRRCREGRGRLCRDRTGMRSGRGGAAAARPRCRAAGLAAARLAGAARHADAEAGPHRAGPAHARGTGSRRVRHLQLHGAVRSGTVRRYAGGAAPDQSDRRRPGPASPDADRHAGARGAAQRRARLSRRGAVRDRPGVRHRRRRAPALDRRRPAYRSHAAQLACPVAPSRCDGRQGRSLGGHVGDRRAARCTGAHPGRARLLSSRPLRHRAAGTEDRCWAVSANCTRACSRRSISPALSSRSNSTWMLLANRSAGARLRRTCHRSSRSVATSPSWWTRAVTADAVLRAARGADRTLIAGVSLFDVYQGDRLPPGTKSLAIEVVFQPRERTLTDAEIDAASQKVVAAVTKATGATLR